MKTLAEIDAILRDAQNKANSVQRAQALAAAHQRCAGAETLIRKGGGAMDKAVMTMAVLLTGMLFCAPAAAEGQRTWAADETEEDRRRRDAADHFREEWRRCSEPGAPYDETCLLARIGGPWLRRFAQVCMDLEVVIPLMEDGGAKRYLSETLAKNDGCGVWDWMRFLSEDDRELIRTIRRERAAQR